MMISSMKDICLLFGPRDKVAFSTLQKATINIVPQYDGYYRYISWEIWAFNWHQVAELQVILSSTKPLYTLHINIVKQSHQRIQRNTSRLVEITPFSLNATALNATLWCHNRGQVVEYENRLLLSLFSTISIRFFKSVEPTRLFYNVGCCCCHFQHTLP